LPHMHIHAHTHTHICTVLANTRWQGGQRMQWLTLYAFSWSYTAH
jgi:hypothetical protein